MPNRLFRDIFCLICGREEAEVERMHSFPSVLERSRIWQENMGMVFVGETMKNHKICNLHFTPKSYINRIRWRLQKHAVPTLLPCRSIVQPVDVCSETGPRGLKNLRSADVLEEVDGLENVKAVAVRDEKSDILRNSPPFQSDHTNLTAVESVTSTDGKRTEVLESVQPAQHHDVNNSPTNATHGEQKQHSDSCQNKRECERDFEICLKHSWQVHLNHCHDGATNLLVRRSENTCDRYFELNADPHIIKARIVKMQELKPEPPPVEVSDANATNSEPTHVSPVDSTTSEATTTEMIQINTTEEQNFHVINENSASQLICETENANDLTWENASQVSIPYESKVARKVRIKALFRQPHGSEYSTPVCRICLNSVTSDEAIRVSTESSPHVAISSSGGQQTDNIPVLDMLSVVLPRLRMRPEAKIFLCKECVLGLHSSYQLKIRWIETEKRLQDNLRSIDLSYDVQFDPSETSVKCETPIVSCQEEFLDYAQSSAHSEISRSEISPHIVNITSEKDMKETINVVTNSNLVGSVNHETFHVFDGPESQEMSSQALDECQESRNFTQSIGNNVESSCTVNLTTEEIPSRTTRSASNRTTPIDNNEHWATDQARIDSTEYDNEHPVTVETGITDETLGSRRIEWSDGPYLCDLCGEEFQVLSTFKFHFNRNHEPQETNVCEICGMLVKCMHYTMHMRTHNLTYECDVCHEVLNSKDMLEEHIGAVHSLLSGRRHHCEKCGKTFADLINLRMHLKTHQKAFRRKCNFCELQFLVPTRLMQHMLTHFPRPIECKVCGERLSCTYTHIRKHMLIRHKNIEGHRCQFCRKVYWHEKYLRRHLVEEHHNERNNSKQVPSYKCRFCGEIFTVRRILRKHIMSVHRAERFML